MSHANPGWHFARRFHALNNAVLRLVPYLPREAGGEDRCLFCGMVLNASDPGSLPFLAFTSGNGQWVCQACHCEHKDDFNWPAPE